MKKCFVIFLVILYSQTAFSRKEKFGHINFGVGEIFVPSTLRIGFKIIELGLLNRDAIGITVIYRDAPFFVNMGPAYILDAQNIGVYGGSGFYFDIARFFSIRLEFGGAYSIDGFGRAEALTGVSFFF